jgi:hypothetical protein
MKKHPAYVNSRQLDVLVWSEYPEAEGIVDKVATIIDNSGLGHTITPTYRKNLRIVLLELYAAWIEAEELWLGYSRDKNQFAKINRQHPRISAETILKAIDDMEPVNLIHKAPGIEGIARRSRVTWTRHLAQIFSECELDLHMINREADEIYLREKNPETDKNEDIEFKTTNRTLKLCRDVKTVNQCLKRSEITLELSQRERSRLREALRRKDRASVHLIGTQLYRVFNKTFTRGGRWYGHWSQNLLEKYRKYIHINGEPIIEIDYKYLHIAMAYDMIKAEKPERDLYTPPGVDPRNRNLCKRLLQALLNAETIGEAHSATGLYAYENPKVGPYGKNTTIKSLSKSLRDMHKPIESYLGSGAWKVCQYEDSEIAKKIMLAFAKDNIACLPIHDSFLVAKCHEARLEELMMNVYHDRFHVWPVLEKK